MFSMFDPSTSTMKLSWMIMVMPLIIKKHNKMNMMSKKMKIILMVMNSIKKEVGQLMEKKEKKMSVNLMTSMFVIMVICNLMAIIPFNFTPTAHISMTMTLSMTMWTSTMMWGWKNSFKMMMLHLTPSGTPNSLMNFMVIIELLSNIIRPMTLSIRMTANMVAGHLLMLLLSNFSMMNYSNMWLMVVFMIMLSVLELMVAMVQAYVMMMLISLYHNESL